LSSPINLNTLIIGFHAQCSSAIIELALNACEETVRKVLSINDQQGITMPIDNPKAPRDRLINAPCWVSHDFVLIQLGEEQALLIINPAIDAGLTLPWENNVREEPEIIL
jgi:hypothetical protein